MQSQCSAIQEGVHVSISALRDSLGLLENRVHQDSDKVSEEEEVEKEGKQEEEEKEEEEEEKERWIHSFISSSPGTESDGCVS